MSDIPEPVRREVRQEANFGCAICGNPIIEIHHIVPRSEEEHNDPERMIALCRNHHALAGPQAEGITPDQLYEYKEDPHNSDLVDYDFYFESETPLIEFAGCKCQLRDLDKMSILSVNGDDLVTMSYSEGVLQFSARLYNQEGDLVAELNENEWTAYTEDVWDLTYNGNQFKIWHDKRDIGIEIRYDSDTDRIFMRGNFYKDGALVRATPSKIVFPGNNQVIGCTFIDCRGALALSTK
ncbi:HNH endonuclease [Salarchaeum sp. JOR-1]|uniref:HNH endonuclease n=1 Tax=Salarchaeum sp. JOR-1 TaxID=2599399 RepID=UPI0011986ACF|nr:HNH endonuclease signature motif containing protein [Salarchaeum sp. JOR-1]QDX39851.1 HNH endonuclease [Salarchaeum sp. JOR-1]